jgi:hypothetical protein
MHAMRIIDRHGIRRLVVERHEHQIRAQSRECPKKIRVEAVTSLGPEEVMPPDTTVS